MSKYTFTFDEIGVKSSTKQKNKNEETTAEAKNERFQGEPKYTFTFEEITGKTKEAPSDGMSNQERLEALFDEKPASVVSGDNNVENAAEKPKTSSSASGVNNRNKGKNQTQTERKSYNDRANIAKRNSESFFDKKEEEKKKETESKTTTDVVTSEKSVGEQGKTTTENNTSVDEKVKSSDVLGLGKGPLRNDAIVRVPDGMGRFTIMTAEQAVQAEEANIWNSIVGAYNGYNAAVADGDAEKQSAQRKSFDTYVQQYKEKYPEKYEENKDAILSAQIEMSNIAWNMYKSPDGKYSVTRNGKQERVYADELTEEERKENTIPLSKMALHSAGYLGEKLVGGAVDGVEDTADFLLSLPINAVAGVASIFGSGGKKLSNTLQRQVKVLNESDLINYWNTDSEDNYELVPQGVKNWGWLPETIGRIVPTIAETIYSGGSNFVDDLSTAGNWFVNAAKRVVRSPQTHFGISAAGSSTEEALQKGADTTTALTYGGASGAVEVLTESLFGGFAGTEIGEALIDFKVASPAIRKVLNILTEGLEEDISAFADPALQRITGVDANAEWATWSDYKESASHGIILSLVMQIATAPFNASAKKRHIEDINKATQAINEVIFAEEYKLSPLSKYATEEEIQNRKEELQAIAVAYDEAVERAVQNERQSTETPEQIIIPEDIKESDVSLKEGETISDSSIVLEKDENKYPYDQQEVIEGYEEAVNDELLVQIEKVKSGNYKDNDTVYFSGVSNQAANKIKTILGIDVSGFKSAIEARQLRHILKRHGKGGKADSSMRNDSDIARIGYVLDNFDSVEYGGKAAGYTTKTADGKTKQADTVLYSKKINGTYYVVQAVPDTNKKTLYVVTAYIGNKKTGTEQLADAQSPSETSENDFAHIPANNSISQKGGIVNSKSLEQVISDIESKQNQVSELDKTLDALSAAGEELEADDVKKATGFGDYGAKLVSDLVRDENMTFTDAKRVVATAYLAGFSGLDGKKASFETDTQINAFTAGKADRITQDTVAREKAKKAAVYDTDIKTETREVPNRESDNLAISEQFEQIDNTSKKFNTTNPQDESPTERAERIDTYIESTVASNSFAINEQHAGGRNIATMKTFFHTIHYQKKSNGSITVYVEGERTNGMFAPNEEVGTYDTVEEAYNAAIRYLINEKGIYETYPKTFHQYNDLYNERHQNEVKIEHNKNSDKFVQKSVEKPSDAVYNNKSTDAMAKIEARQKKMQEVMSRFGLTEDEAFAVVKYKTAEAYKINAALRDDETQLNEYQKEIVQLLDSALEKLPVHRGTVYRTVSFDDLFNPEEEYNAFLEGHIDGAVVLYKAYTSTSSSIDGHPMPDDTKYGITLEVEGENGRDVDGFGDNFEKEVVYPRGLRFAVTEVGTDSNGRPYIKVKEIIENDRQQRHTEERSNLLQQMQTEEEIHGDLHEISEQHTDRSIDAENSVQGVRADKESGRIKAEQHSETPYNVAEIIENAVESTLKKEIVENVELMEMLQDKFGGDVTTGLVTEIMSAFEKNGSLGEFEALFTDGGQAIYNALNNSSQVENVSYSIDESFSGKYDTWVKNGRKNGVRLHIGSTSEALQSIDVKNQEIYWDSSKINNSLLKHSYLTDVILKQVPFILENPVIVMQSKQSPSRLTMFGEVYDNDGLPIMAVIELLPTSLNTGLILDEIKVVSTHSRKNQKKPADMTQTQNLINNSDILYVDTNKNRTDNWLVANRLQLPLHITNYGPIKSITYPEGNVNTYSMQNEGNYLQEDFVSEQKGSLLSDGSGERSYSASSRKQTKRVDGRTSRYREGRETANERRKYCQALKASGATEQKIIYGHKCEVIPKEHYTDRMKRIERQNSKDGFDETIFITGKAKLPFAKDKNGNSKTAKGIFIKADGRKIAVVQYDNEWYSPEQINDHEKVHDRYNTPLTVKVRNILKNSLTVAEKKKVLARLSSDYSGIIEGNEDKIFEEFVANVLSGMNEYTAIFNDLVRAYWNGNEAFVDKFQVSMYTESIDTGGDGELQNNIGLDNDNLFSAKKPMEVFPPFNEYPHSDANELAIRWAHKSEIAAGTQKLISYQGKWYIIEKFDSAVLKYQIIGELKGSRVKRIFDEVKNRETSGSKQSIQRILDESPYSNESGDRLGTGGYSADNDAVGLSEKNNAVLSMGKEQNDRRNFKDYSGGSTESDSKNRQDSANGELVIRYSSAETNTEKFTQEQKNTTYRQNTDLSSEDNSDFWIEWFDKAREYGVIPKGENPARDVSVPRKTAKDKKVSQTVRTILEAKATPEEAVPDIEKLVIDGVFSYDTYTDKQAINDAEFHIKEYGWEESLKDWFDSVEKGNVSKENTAMGWALYNNAANLAATTTSETERTSAIKTSLSILDEMVKHQRSAAQALQATRILKRLSPETQLYGVQKSVQALQKELSDRYGKKAPDLKIDEGLAEQFIKAETQEEREAIEQEIYKDIGRQMPSRFIDKWNAWRYLAMLGNLRTHVRNITGNAGFAPVVLAKDLTATAIEVAVHRVSGGKTVRSKSIVYGSKADRALLAAAWKDYANVADLVSNGGKYSDFAMANQYIEKGRKIFKAKPLEWARKANSALLEQEDVCFSKPHYAYALAQYCKANNITPEQIQRGRAIEPARQYAIKEAQKATYKDTNAFSQMVSEWGRNSKGSKNIAEKAFGTVVEGVLPFRKTPANILVRGVEYSPLGLLKGLSYDLVQLRDGKMSAAEVIDNISAGLTGTGLMALGVFLAAQGLIRGHGEDDKDEKEFKELMGHQTYALELPNGTSITLDWLAPGALPFFVGVNIWEATRGSGEKATFSTILEAISNISEPMLEMSCLQSLNDLFESVGYASSNGTSGLISILASAATSYLTQGIPTLLGQAERTGEDSRMTTYTEKNNFLTGDMQYALGKASAKIPFWDYHQIPYIDAWGRREASGTALKRGLNNFLNPAYTSTIEESNMEKELLRLYEETGDGVVFPDRAKKYFTVDGVRKDLTADEYVRYATLKGEKSYKLISDLVQSESYKALSDEEKVKAIDEAYAYADQKAKKAISNYKPDSWVNNADKFGQNVGNYLSFRANVSDTREDNGGTISKQEVVDIITDMAQNDSETWLMYLSMYDSKSDTYARDSGIDGETYMRFLDALDAADKPTESGKYGTYTQDEAYEAIKNLKGLSRQEKAVLWQSVNLNWKAKNNPFG